MQEVRNPIVVAQTTVVGLVCNIERLRCGVGCGAQERSSDGDGTLVERYDAVKFGIFQRNLSNFRGLILFCIEADFCNQILI